MGRRRTRGRGGVRMLVGSLALGGAAALVACLGEDVGAGTEEPTPGIDASPPSSPGDGGGTTPTDAGTPPGPTVDAEAGSGRFCASQVMTPGATDFFCADFDGADYREGFVANVPDAGTLAKVTDVFFSSPAAVTVRGNARLRWEKAGPMPFDVIDARVKVNVGVLGGAYPNTTGSVTVLGLYTPDTQVEIRWVRGLAVEGVAYTGYMLGWSHCSAGCLANQVKLATMNLPANLWHDVRMTWATDGKTTVTVGATVVFSGTSYGVASTVAGVQLGLEENATSPVVARHAYDNLVVNITRK